MRILRDVQPEEIIYVEFSRHKPTLQRAGKTKFYMVIPHQSHHGRTIDAVFCKVVSNLNFTLILQPMLELKATTRDLDPSNIIVEYSSIRQALAYTGVDIHRDFGRLLVSGKPKPSLFVSAGPIGTPSTTIPPLFEPILIG
jgi:hypothetical protein